MLGRASLIVFVLVGASLAGCISGKKEDKVETETSKPAGLLPNETVAPDGRAISAFNETNKTETTGIGAMVHTHDFWKGKERLENVAWIDSGLIPFPIMPCKKADNSCTAGASSPNSDTYPVGTAIADYDLAPPPEMGMIYEGTKTVELKLTKLTGPGVASEVPEAPANPTGHVFFDYLPANDEPGHFRTGGELRLNEPFKIDIKPTDADMPHQTKSLWIFRVYSNSQMVEFNFNISVTVVKGYDVVNWPPHPDLYADKPARAVFDGAVKLASKGTLDANVWGSDAGWVHPEKVISWGTDRVDIEVSNVQFASQAPVQPSGWVFEYNNASKPPLLGHGAQYSARLKDAGSDGKSFHFSIDLTKDRGDAMDTPYAQFSRWGFRLVPFWEDTAVGKCVDEAVYPGFLFGCQWYPWDMTYTLKVTALGHSTAEGVPAGAQ